MRFGFLCLLVLLDRASAIKEISRVPVYTHRLADSGWALAIVAVSAAIGIGAVAVHLATGVEAWFWAAVPATLASGSLLFAIARLWPAFTRNEERAN